MIIQHTKKQEKQTAPTWWTIAVWHIPLEPEDTRGSFGWPGADHSSSKLVDLLLHTAIYQLLKYLFGVMVLLSRMLAQTFQSDDALLEP